DNPTVREQPAVRLNKDARDADLGVKAQHTEWLVLIRTPGPWIVLEQRVLDVNADLTDGHVALKDASYFWIFGPVLVMLGLFRGTDREQTNFVGDPPHAFSKLISNAIR